MTVSIGAVHSAAGAASYFASDNYYTAEQAEGASQWAGEGAREAGLSGKIDTQTFENILNGKLPDGTQVGDPGKRDHGRDFTFSMPKSASLLALVSGDKRILEAHIESVKETMAWAEKNLAEARIKVDGKDVAVRTGNLVYGLFQHDTSRKTDPQSHIHAVIANMTRLPQQHRNPDKIDARTGEVTRDDGWRAWHNGEMYKYSTMLTSMDNALLRDKLEKLGYTTELTPGGAHGAFEVLGPKGERIAQSALDGFSKRSTDIKAKAEELGITSAEGRREITKRTRDGKSDAGDRQELAERWRAEAKDLGYNGDAIYRAALEKSAALDGKTMGSVERGVIAVTNAIRAAQEKLAHYLRRPDDPLVDKGLARLTMLPSTANAQYATASAVRILGTKEAAFGQIELIKTALDLGLKGVTAQKVEKRVEQLIEKDQLVQGKSNRYDGAGTVYTTREAINQELRILAAMDTGMGQARPLMSADVARDRLQELAGDRQLNHQQLAAAIQIVSSQDRIVLVQGRAGAGKSTMLQPIAKAEALDATARMLGENGEKAILLTADLKGDAKALAFQNKMVADLKTDTGLDAMTVHSFLYRNEKMLNGEAGAEAFAARKTELQGTYLILDEGSMISNEQMDKLTQLANIMEVGRLAIVGDRKQLNPIDAGKAFSLMQARSIKDSLTISEVNINMRQRNDTMRLVADLADAGNVKAAIEVLGDRVVEVKPEKGAAGTDKHKNSIRDDLGPSAPDKPQAEPPSAVSKAAEAWLALSAEERDKTTLLPSSRADRAQANEIIQTGLIAEGTLKGEGRNLNVRERVDVDHEQMRYARLWGTAKYLEVNNKQNSLGLARGDYRIDKVFENGKVGLTAPGGDKIRIDPFKIDPTRKNDGLRLAGEKVIRIHEGERIRWTDSDKREGRGMINATIAHVEKVTPEGISVRLNTGEARELQNGDAMLKRIDLAYAINTHMAQGITNSAVFAVMNSWQRNLTNARAFLVNLTRQQDDARIFTDDKDKLVKQLVANRGNKDSALEAIGTLAVESILKDKDNETARERDLARDRDLGLPGESVDIDRLRDASLADASDIVLPEREEKQAKPDLDLGERDLGSELAGATKSDGLDPAAATAAKQPDSSVTQAPPAEREELQIDRSKGLEL